MSYASEIRAALRGRPDYVPVSAFWRDCPSARSAAHLQGQLSAFVHRNELLVVNVAGQPRKFKLNPNFVAPKPGRRYATASPTKSAPEMVRLAMAPWEAS